MRKSWTQYALESSILAVLKPPRSGEIAIDTNLQSPAGAAET
ncbi:MULTISPECIES: hypothetical protein [Luteimonas]|uniref:Uncharacterized protein n=1 Tax=Luteimonas terrae TaxID=1530191 RepID=A0ABU1Y0T5_9GAMM|nr:MULTISPECIES: hypothetical protein [Luteimonas]MDR6990679.1 hypothetical protein [Luteimonas sp. 3794]MDR7194635.1 hypothetical protein [Luteimonas terrae]